MRGNNTLYLNQATMIEALQEYFDKRYTVPVQIASVTQNTGGSYEQQNTFEVSVTEKPAEPQ